MTPSCLHRNPPSGIYRTGPYECHEFAALGQLGLRTAIHTWVLEPELSQFCSGSFFLSLVLVSPRVAPRRREDRFAIFRLVCCVINGSPLDIFVITSA